MIDQAYFDELVKTATSSLSGSEILLATLHGEDTDFVRFNHSDVRQAGSISQSLLDLELVDGRRHVQASVQLTQDHAMDQQRLDRVLGELRDQIRIVGDDPFLFFNTDGRSTEQVAASHIPDGPDAMATIRAAGAGRDLVGLYTAGTTCTGFGNSLGQRNWFQAGTFDFDWTFYIRADKAAKNSYAGAGWDDTTFARKVDWSTHQIEALERTPIDLEPGSYRTYLAPAAAYEVVDLLAGGSFGEKAHRTKRTPLLHMITDDARLAAGTRISEDTVGGFAPNFQEQGFPRPDEVVLIEDGCYVDTLVSPRSALEYGLETNGASAGEHPESLAIAPGGLAAADAMAALGSGLHVGNLWYTNYSDRPACRVTGMTRFATFWVEGGELAAPVNVMRFDDTLYHVLGSNLIDLTDEAEVVSDSSTYGRRSNGSCRLPGVLLEEMRFTL